MDEQSTPISRRADRDGRRVDVLLRDGSPTVWWLRWILDTGCITTHLRAQDGIERVDQILASVSIDEGGTNPLLIIDAPLFAVHSGRVGYEESALWFSDDYSRWLKFVRPGYLKQGQFAEGRVGSDRIMRAGVLGNLELHLIERSEHGTADEEFLQLADSVVIR